MEQAKPYEEINQTIDKLAQSIKSKTDELNELKLKYDIKLKELNNYLNNLKLIKDENNDTDKGIEELIESKVNCKKCGELVWDIRDINKCDYLLIPKVGKTITNKTDKTNDKIDEDINMINNQIKDINLMNLNNTKNKNKKKKKMTCSYCNKEGHKRSECQLRLTKE